MENFTFRIIIDNNNNFLSFIQAENKSQAFEKVKKQYPYIKKIILIK